MELLALNAAAARLVRKDGRDYRVAPMTLIVPGVLAGSKGPLLYPPDECRNSVNQWDGTPITMFHPTDAVGMPVSAAHPSAKQIGFLAKTTFNGRLRSEGWFDVLKTKAADAEMGTNVLYNLERGIPTQLSTGLYTDNQPSKGQDKGRLYEYIARNYRADHLAVLPGQVGACSISDGCGVLVNAGGFDSDEQRQAFFGLKSEGKVAGTKAAKSDEPAGPWHAGREEVFAGMRKLGAENDRNWEQAKKLGPHGGSLSIGSADFDHTLKATVGDQYLRSLRQGKHPDEAHKDAVVAGNEAVSKWNSQGVKGRVGVGGAAEMKRWEGAGESAADHVHAMFKSSLPEKLTKNSKKEGCGDGG